MLNDLSLQTETALVFLNGLLTILLRNALVQLIYNGGGTTINQEDLKWFGQKNFFGEFELIFLFFLILE